MCLPAELVDTKKKRRDSICSDDDDLDGSNVGAGESDDDFGTEHNENSSGHDNDALEHGNLVNEAVEGIRHFDAFCCEDIRLMIMRSPQSGERDVLLVSLSTCKTGRRVSRGNSRSPHAGLLLFWVL
ncbi:hypothetical protein BDZ45DRAFT_775057 [Acephala macrosclerotiorum]|nr:hypothetical protein BDZ45DRAFT_775057 [Acephala macrosclerotiorum]